ncbi:MAG: hypothetical protein LRZ85_03580 [Alphaproteobacteria bacterium]|nr:hypothetical protein [Alphaproteobacteria bacterium]MCD8570251.1 hypothetical protein [Alphaproteobacteria bacterium]
MVSDVTFQSAAAGAQQTNTSTVRLAEDFDDFLVLLTTQLQNQDPLSPMDTTEFTNQLVAFAGVEQQINTNQKLDDLVALELSGAFSTALGYVGLNINYISNEFAYDGSSTNRIAYAFDGEAASSKISIYNEAGDLVYQTTGTTSPGSNEFFWDGTMTNGLKAPAGTYDVKIDALSSNGTGVESTVVVSGKVGGVESQGGQIYLIVGKRAVNIGSIINVNDDANSKNGTALTNGLNYIGKEITYSSEQFKYDGATPVQMTLDIADGANQGTFQILNKQGQVIFEDKDIADNSGTRGFIWNGYETDGSKAAAGQYIVKLNVSDLDGEKIDASASFVGIGQSVLSSGSSVAIEVNDTSVPLNKIKQVKTIEPAPPEEAS